MDFVKQKHRGIILFVKEENLEEILFEANHDGEK